MGDFLTGARLAHVYRVAETAVALAKKWGVSEEDAYLAGLLHDVAKNLTPELIEKEGVLVSLENRSLYAAYPKVWHAFAAPLVLQSKFPALPESVLSSVQWHTTGTMEMSALSQIIYVADFIEPGREAHGVAFIRELAFENLDEATFGLATCSLLFLLKHAEVIHPQTFLCLDYYRSQLSVGKARGIAAKLVG